MLTHSRLVPFSAPADGIPATEQHVRAHLSSVASPDDDEARYVDEVVIRHETGDDGILIVGTLDRPPDAPYLREDFDPEQDTVDNPLSVPSILREGQ